MTYQITGGVVAVVKVAKKVALEVVALTVQESISLILKFITLIIVKIKMPLCRHWSISVAKQTECLGQHED